MGYGCIHVPHRYSHAVTNLRLGCKVANDNHSPQRIDHILSIRCILQAVEDSAWTYSNTCPQIRSGQVHLALRLSVEKLSIQGLSSKLSHILNRKWLGAYNTPLNPIRPSILRSVAFSARAMALPRGYRYPQVKLPALHE